MAGPNAALALVPGSVSQAIDMGPIMCAGHQPTITSETAAAQWQAGITTIMPTNLSITLENACLLENETNVIWVREDSNFGLLGKREKCQCRDF